MTKHRTQRVSRLRRRKTLRGRGKPVITYNYKDTALYKAAAASPPGTKLFGEINTHVDKNGNPVTAAASAAKPAPGAAAAKPAPGAAVEAAATLAALEAKLAAARAKAQAARAALAEAEKRAAAKAAAPAAPASTEDDEGDDDDAADDPNDPRFDSKTKEGQDFYGERLRANKPFSGAPKAGRRRKTRRTRRAPRRSTRGRRR